MVADQIREAICQADVLVLGGDIFDFKWSTLPTLQDSVDASIDWIRDMMEVNRSCQLQYVLGNHDAHPRFVDALQGLAKASHDQLRWDPYWFRTEDSVFLHGDIVDGALTHEVLSHRRSLKADKLVRSQVSHLLYDVAVWAKIHRAVIQIEQRRINVFHTLAEYLSRYQLGPDQGIKNVYFGHIHRVIQGVPYGGMNFYNGGASIRGLNFKILDASLPSS